MYHSVTFDNKNTWDDWRLIPSPPPVFAPPPIKASALDIPGADGKIDTTETMAKRTLYGNRTGSFKFIVENDFRPWHVALSDIMSYLHGRRRIAILEDDPHYYYKGRFTVENWDPGAAWSSITIGYDVDPFKYELATKSEEDRWDPFNFTQDGLAKNYRDLACTGSLTVTIPGRKLLVVPTIIVTAPMSLTFGQSTYQLAKGPNKPKGLYLTAGTNNSLVFTGNGNISIDYRGGIL